MLRYRTNGLNGNQLSSNSLEGFTHSTYVSRPTILGRYDDQLAVNSVTNKETLSETDVFTAASARAKDIIGLENSNFKPTGTETLTKPAPFGLSPITAQNNTRIPHKEIISSAANSSTATASNPKQKKSHKLPKTKILKKLKPQFPKLSDWQDFKIFSAGATLAASMIVLGFYLGFNRPITNANSDLPAVSSDLTSEASAVDQSSATPVVKITDDGHKVEVDQGVNPNNVDRRPPAPVSPNMPVRMKISSIGVNAPIRSVGLLPDKSLAVPNLLNQVGWYDQSARPGEAGTVLMDGHYDPNLSGVVFRRLKEVTTGTEIEVVRGDGQVITYVVEDKGTYDKNATPMDKAFFSDDKQRLSIVTCEGKWLDREKTFSHRLIVYAVRK